MPNRLFEQEHIDYIEEVAHGRYNYDIAEMVNKRFNLNVTEAQIKNFKTRHKIKSNVKNKRRTPNKQLFTEEQITFIKNNTEGLTNIELTALVNHTFKLSITLDQMKGWKKNNKVTSGVSTRFENGHVPYTKGKKQEDWMSPEQIERAKKNWYTDGHIPDNYTPVGTERLSSDGYIRIKVQDQGEWHERWRLKHKLLWEKENGPIPEDKILTFLDGEQTNVSLENLTLITRAQHLMMTRQNLRFDNPELTKVGASVAALATRSFELNKRDDVE